MSDPGPPIPVLRFLGKLEGGEPVCPEGARGRVGHLRRGIRAGS